MRLHRFHLLVGVELVLGCLFVIQGCEGKAAEGKGDFTTDTVGAAYKTYVEYVRAVNAGKGKLSEDIPEQYWADGIKALKPVKVYQHRANIVAVQEASGEMERGKYIYIPVSSYIPHSGDDGFTFTEQTDSVYNYTRRLVN